MKIIYLSIMITLMAQLSYADLKIANTSTTDVSIQFHCNPTKLYTIQAKTIQPITITDTQFNTPGCNQVDIMSMPDANNKRVIVQSLNYTNNGSILLNQANPTAVKSQSKMMGQGTETTGVFAGSAAALAVEGVAIVVAPEVAIPLMAAVMTYGAIATMLDMSNILDADNNLHCKVNYYPDTSGIAICMPCGYGTYSQGENPLGSANNGPCLPCPINTYAPNYGTGCYYCPAGQGTNATGSTSCSLCPFGQYAPNAGSGCQSCPANTYANEKGSTSCRPCPNGYTSQSGSAICIPPAPKNQQDCLDFLSSCMMDCNTPSIINTADCTANCSKATQNCITKVTGNSNLAAQITSAKIGALTSNCPVGTYYSPKTNQCAICPLNYFTCDMGSSTFTCKPGYYSDGTNCIACNAGTFLTTSGATSALACIACPANQYSSIGASSCTPCPAGQGSLTSSTMCSTCPAGQYAPKDGSGCLPCPANTYSNAVGATSCSLCPAGQGSLAGSISCTLCPAGKYAPKDGSGCLPCPANNYAKGVGNISCTQCPANTNCLPGSSSFSCNAGSYYNGVTCMPCPSGTYLPGPGATNASACRPCQSGQFSAAGSSSCQACPVNTYLQSAKSTVCTPCPAGSDSQSKTGVTSCTPCPAGQNSISGGSCTACPANTQGNLGTSTGSTRCDLCPAGQGSTAGSACTPCSAGQYAPTAGSSCLPCPANTFSSTSGATSCTPCASSTKSSTGSTSCSSSMCSGNTIQSGNGCIPCKNGQIPNTEHTRCIDY